MVLDFSHCDAIELGLEDPELDYRWKATRQPERITFHFAILPNAKTSNRSIISALLDPAMGEMQARKGCAGKLLGVALIHRCLSIQRMGASGQETRGKPCNSIYNKGPREAVPEKSRGRS